jgi:tetratricopeptide (TPR) repeat protein
LDRLALEPSHTYWFSDPETGEVMDDGGAEPLIQRLRILGATGVRGPPLDSAFLDLRDHWPRIPGSTDREIQFLRTVTAPRIAVALWSSPSVLESWISELDLRDPLWAALRPDVERRDTLLRVALNVEEWEVNDPSRSHLLGAVAHEVGDNALAVRLFSRLDSLVYRVDSRDSGWGLLALSYLQRGKAYEALEEPEQATEFYERFLAAWSEPDLPASLAQEARQRLNDLSRTLGQGF